MTTSLATAILRYVPHHEIERYLHAGWTITHDLSDCCHGQYSVLMVRPDDQDALTATIAPARSSPATPVSQPAIKPTLNLEIKIALNDGLAGASER